MISSSTPFRIAALISSVVDIVSSHSLMSCASLDVRIDEQAPDPLQGDADRVRQALIIIIERALIQRPHNPIMLDCSVIRRSSALATVLFSITQRLGAIQAARGVHVSDLDHEIDQPDIPEELSLKIAERIIRECKGKLLIRPRSPRDHEVFFWVPMEIMS